MTKILLPALLLAASVALPSIAQKRASDEKPVSFQERMQRASGAWDKGSYGTCMTELQGALSLCAEKRSQEIRKALPAAPEGWEALPDPKDDQRNNPFAAAMTASVGNIVTRSYEKSDGSDRVEVTVTADSPLVSMFNMWVTNPAMLGNQGELVEYENDDKAVLKNQGGRLELQILISKAHMCEVKASGLSEDQLFAMFDQSAVSKLRTALGQ